MRDLLKTTPRPDGVFCYNDPVAAGAVKAVLEAGLSVPEDIAIIGAGNVHYSDLLRVPLSTIDQSSAAIGETAAELLCECMEAKTPAAMKRIFIPSRLVIRESSQPLMRGALCLAASATLCAQQFDVAAFDRARVIKAADSYLNDKPVTVTASHSPRSAGGLHDFFSEGDYWWPDPKNPGGPYIQRDGMTNPDNFVEHRKALMRLSVEVPALAAAWKLTHEKRYADRAALHLRAWFVDDATRMNPSLQYAQAIHGRFTGRGTGIIDTIHLVEVARAIEELPLSKPDLEAIKKWFADYTAWMMTHAYGIAERDATNNHGTCWVMQVAAFAHLTGDEKTLKYANNRFKTVLLPNQEAADGSFPQEMRRTKPYGYSLFNLEAFSTIAQILSTKQRQPVGLRASRWARAAEGRRVHGAVHSRQKRSGR